MRADGRRLLRELEALALERPLDRIEEARRREVFGGARRLWSGEGRTATLPFAATSGAVVNSIGIVGLRANVVDTLAMNGLRGCVIYS